MKLNWGNSIAIFFSLFVVFILFMVYKATTVNHDLVSDNYYLDELKYQDVIDGMNNFNATGSRLGIDQKENGIILSIPEKTLKGFDSGSVILQRPSNQNLDLSLPWNGKKEVFIASDQLVAGKYKFILNWTSAGLPFHVQRDYFVE